MIDKILKILLLLLVTSNLNSQLIVTTSYLELCDFDISTGLISDNCNCKGVESLDTFTIDIQKSVILHKIDNNLSTYRIVSYLYDDTIKEFNFRVIGLHNQDYVIVVSINYLNIKVFFMNEYDKIVVLIYQISDIY